MGFLDKFFKAATSNPSDSFDPYEYDWWCDECDAPLNSQPGFNPNCGTWICNVCGHENIIAESEVIGVGWEPEYESDDSESINVWDAAEIWRSNGFDEDYTFGFTEEELKNALDD
jgi:hypothetical protein